MSETTPQPQQPAVVPLLLDQEAAWQFCGLTRSAWYRLRSTGDILARLKSMAFRKETQCVIHTLPFDGK